MESRPSVGILEIVLAIFIPPLAVALKFGLSKEFWICVLLTILGGVPGMIYALYVLFNG